MNNLESEKIYRAIGESIDYGVWICAPDGRNLYASDSFLNLVGLTQEECSDFGWGGVLHPDDAERTILAWKECVRTQGDWDMEHRFRGVDGQWHPILARGVPVRNERGEVVYWAGINLDISRIKQVEEAVRLNEERLQLAIDAAHLATWDWDISSGTIIWNSEHYRMLGYEPGSFAPTYHHWAERVHPDDLAATEARIQKTIDIGDDYQSEFRVVLPGGTVRTLESLGRIERDQAGIAVRLYGAMSDITEKKQIVDELNRAKENLEQRVVERTAELRKSQELFSLFMKHTPVYTFIKEVEGDQSRVVLVSDNFIDMVGRPAEELRDKTMDELFPGDFARKITADDLKVLKDGKVIQLDEELDGRSYTTIKFPIISENNNKLIAGFTLDITENKRQEEERRALERQLLHAQKLESLGVLAGGIAHDFNNILTAIIGNAELALMKLNAESPVVANLQQIEQAAMRAADLAKQMLAYSGKGKFLIENLDLNRILEEMVHMLEVSISKKAQLRLHLTPELPFVEVDATQIRQLIMNLVINASEAIGDESGVIAINTGSMECDKSYLQDFIQNENMRDGLYIYLEITDTGSGMDKETLSKLFDPFFTTKFTGRGLGMAAAQGIVRGHKGGIKVYSEPGRGTSFKVLLPASGRRAAIQNVESVKEEWQGSGTVLLVDDEETIRGIGAEMLKELGFTVITAKDGIDAVEKYRSGSDISCVLLDLTMPRMDGEQCFKELRLINPEVKVIVSSGYSEQEVSQKFLGKRVDGFMQKPYKFSVLKEMIKKLFSKPATVSPFVSA